MSEISDRFYKVAGGFTERVNAVSVDAWNNSSPCDGWAARDIVRHLTEWVPGYFAGVAGVELPGGPSADDDPVGAWTALNDAIGAMLEDHEIALREFDGPTGRMSIEGSIDMMVTGDVLIHTWDLARSAGLDDTLDAVEVHRMLEGMEPFDAMLRNSGHYGSRVVVPDDADEQTRLIAFVGREPGGMATT